LIAPDLLRQLQDHAGSGALVRFTRPVDIEVAQADHDLRRIFARPAPRQVIELDLGKGVDVGRLRRLIDLVHAGGDAISSRGRGIDEPSLAALEVIEEIAPRFNIIVRLPELVVVGRVSDRGEMENEVNLATAEIMFQVKLRQVARDDVALEALEILEVAGAEVIHHGQLGLGVALGHFVDQVRPDESGSAGNDDMLIHNEMLHDPAAR
jgi:hypothetical protein